MACFLAPMAQAIVVSVIKKNAEKKEAVAEQSRPENVTAETQTRGGIPLSRKLGWLTKMLWGGVFLLAIEHIWHGEVVLWPPFLTAMNNPAEVQPMLMEIVSVGGTMMVLVTTIWVAMVVVADHLERKASVTAASISREA